ncbi:MAG: hypothetical protein ACOX0A_04355 [Thermoguttaceae bacterium]
MSAGSKKKSSKVRSDKEKPLKNATLTTESKPETQCFDIDVIRKRIAEVKLSAEEIARRKKLEETKRHYRSGGVEGVYSGPLPKWEPGWLVVQGAREHNLKSIDVPFPLSALTVVTGVSGSGKSTLVEDVLFTSLSRILSHSNRPCNRCDGIWGADRLKSVVHVDQTPIGQSPTSNAATYTGLFDHVRTLYSQLPEAKVRGYSPRRFSFNVPGGRCEKCEGSGVLKVDMHLLADIWITCDVCGGKRYNPETLQVKYRGLSIADLLETTCGDALRVFEQSPRMKRILQTLCDVGLDYLPLGQPATTLSGGEAQRVKLAAELSRTDTGKTFYVLDEPTTGLHFEDVRKLLLVLHRLVDLGNTVVVVEHNLDVIKNADWLIEIGPGAGSEGGLLVFAGTPEQLLEYTANWTNSPDFRASRPRCYTGEALFPVFEKGTFVERQPLDVKQYWQTAKEAAADSNSLAVSSSSNSSIPLWISDGQRWHTELRWISSKVDCFWDSRILTLIAERLPELSSSMIVDWDSENLVEARVYDKPGAWFMRATTSDQWLLTLRFRAAKDSFDHAQLAQSLALKPLNEIDEIPLWGTQSRVRVKTVGAWQEVELRVFSLDEIDKPEFWDFLKQAVERFSQQSAVQDEDDSDLTPWKSQGREWHFSLQGFYGDDVKPVWPFELLEKIVDDVQNTNPTGIVDWYRKIDALFQTSVDALPWVRVFTKNTDYVYLWVNAAKETFSAPALQREKLGYALEFDPSNPKYDVVYLRYRSLEEYDAKTLQSFLLKAFNSLHKK